VTGKFLLMLSAEYKLKVDASLIVGLKGDGMVSSLGTVRV